MRIPHRLYLLATLLPLLLVVCLPDLRLPARKLALNWQNANANTGYVPIPEYWPSTEDVLKRKPEALEGKVWAVAHGSFPPQLKKFERDVEGNRSSDGKLMAFAELAKSNRHDPWLLAQGVIQPIGSDGRVAGPWESNWHLNMSGAVGFERVPVNSLSQSEIAVGLSLARRGQQLEPQNTLFDWMVARFLFAQRRDEEAIQVIVGASRKTQFDMHWRQDWKASVWARECHGPLLPEEKVLAGFGTLLPHLAQMRHVTMMGLWVAMQKEDAGDTKRSLEILGGLARLNVTRLGRSFFAIEMLGAAKDLQCVLRAPKEMRQARSFYGNKFKTWPLPLGDVLPPQASLSPEQGAKHQAELVSLMDGLSESLQSHAQTAASDAAAFARHCLQGERADLAKQAKRYAPLLKNSFLRVEASQTQDAFMSYFNGGDMTELALWWFAAEVGVQLLVTSLVAYAFLAALQAIVRRFRLGKRSSPGSYGNDSPSESTATGNSSAVQLNPRYATYPFILGLASSIVITACGALLICQAWADKFGLEVLPFSDCQGLTVTCNYLALSFPTIYGSLAILGVLVHPKTRTSWRDMLRGGLCSLHQLQVWLVPASLWWILVCLNCMASPRQLVEAKWHHFLQSENQARLP